MESSAPVARLAPAGLDPRRWRALALLCGAFFMVLLDGTITIVALPSIGADLRFSEQGLQWVLSAYALTFGGLLLLGGRAADLLGRRRVFMAGVLLFTAASLVCGLAWSPAALLAARVAQGAGAAIMTPTALSIISTTFTEGSERNKALGIWVGTVAVGMPFVLTLYAQRVLGYSALKFGVSSVVLALAVTAGAIAGQAAILKAGFRPVAATGMALMGAGSLVLTQVSVHGGYFPDIFFGLLLCGLGIGLAFVTATVAALAGVAEHEAGLASGLSNTALQTGTALGVAIVSTVAVSRSQYYLASKGANPLAALTEGYQSAFLACAVLAGIGLAMALLLPGRPGKQRTSCRSLSRRPAAGIEKRTS